MGDKSPSISVRIDRDTKDRLDRRDDLNLSGLMRGLLDDYLHVGDSVEVALQKRIQEKEEQLKELEMRKTDIQNQIDRTEREIEDLRNQMQERRNSTPDEVIEFAEKIKADNFNGELTADNLAVQTKADSAGIPPSDFIRQVEERL